MPNYWRCGLSAIVLACTVMSLSALAGVEGSYACRGTNPDGSPYSGTVEITQHGEGYLVAWSIGGSGYSGTGIFSENQLSASWGVKGSEYGIVVYKLENDGRLVGKWLNPSSVKYGTETLTPR